MLELFAAISPLECLRFNVPSVMDFVAAWQGEAFQMQLVICDVSSACSYAPTVRPVYVTIGDGDPEEGDEQRCGRLIGPMYGAMDAALN